MTTKNELVADNERYASMVETAREGIKELEAYLMSPKFHEDAHVSVSDVIARTREILSAITDEEFVPYGMACAIRWRGGEGHVATNACHAVSVRMDRRNGNAILT